VENADIRGKKLTFDTLSGGLLKIQGFRGTICNVKEFDYLKRKINGESLPEVEEADEAKKRMVEKIIPLIKGLAWQDFELLVDLVFSTSGWRRISTLGKTQKDIDMELILPTTNERAYVQIKSSTGKGDLAEHVANVEDSDVYSRLFFVFHTGDIKETEEDKVTVIGPNKLARMVFDVGLTSWLIDKRS
jgi:hypothetical protein